MNIQDKDIVFVTPTVGSIWLFYQQFLLNKFFPNSPKILVNGNRRWDFNLGKNCVWYDFINKAILDAPQCKYFVHIDEDCFLINKEGILDSIHRLENSTDSLAGPIDNMWPIRGGNPYALNSFFMIGKTNDLKSVWEKFDINLRFKHLNIDLPEIPEHKIEDEPYYNFFWNYLQQKKTIQAIKAGFDKETNSTTLLASNDSIFAHHMWYTRHWYKNDIFVSLTHRQRYLLMRKKLNKTFNITVFKLLSSMDYKQYIPIVYTAIFVKNYRRVKKRLLK